MSQPQPAERVDFFEWAWKHKLMMLPIVLALMLSVCGGVVGMIYISALSGVRENPLHREAVTIASENEQVRKALGEPMAGGFIESGTINIDEEAQFGSADIEIPISGPLGRGRLIVEGKLAEGNWSVEKLTASLENGQVIPLVDERIKADKAAAEKAEAEKAETNNVDAENAGADETANSDPVAQESEQLDSE